MLSLVTGGASNGKSALAEAQCVSLAGGGPLIYLATMRIWDREGEEKVRLHRERRRGLGFVTVERYTDIGGADVRGVCLLECLPNLLANEMFDVPTPGDRAADRILAGIDRLRQKTAHLVIVTNEIFDDAGSYSPSVLEYMDALGRLNCAIAAMADTVTEAVAGIGVKIK
ncbi:MAG: bifunctional adenosylcobinamide kinase/adenosylcobinamide-phosphate guanylyltransferase [Abditibacteriota bacterium]|nr:bifunctional adenosylcobinamide kinase/adenosylcobinamide-phosphate guanylyltransferase [Abditibacteriota bacterium]